MRHNLLFVGDIVLQSRPRFSPELQALFDGCAVRCGNVEAPLRGFGKSIAKAGPILDQDPAAPEWLDDLGFNLFGMANNHIYDYGEEGLLRTMQAFGSKKDDNVLGVGDGERAYGLLVKTIDNVRYGFLAYGENSYGALNGDRTSGHAWVNHPRVDADIARYGRQVDVLIVQVHAGVEMVDFPIPEWRDRYRKLLDLGADLVIGHHPHVVQGTERYKGKYICYSLGNFCFDGDRMTDTAAWNTGGLLRVQVDNGHIAGIEFDLVEKKGQMLSLKNRGETAELMSVLNGRLSDEAAYLAQADALALEHWRKHHAYYHAKVFNGLPHYSLFYLAKHFKRLLFNQKTDYSMLWHNLNIESNIWLVKRASSKLMEKSPSRRN